MFANHPELYTSQILCEVMEHSESIVFIGYKKYSVNSGYGWTIKYEGQEKDLYHRPLEYITAIDALHFWSESDPKQCSKKFIDREIYKSLSGFNVPEINRVVSGNWGCGAFKGDIRTKFMVQWIASSLCEKELIYCPFGYQDYFNKEKLF
eukprot:GHVR01062360.1.p1 GENE.GHVR01062360.1~~GHVR01062360.1.p1  ORF type:complete len:150 (+),score=7.19 GHVR01062360.1:1218-1667(+)